MILTTFAGALVLGIFLMQLAHRIRISAIVLLLLGGILAGPSFLGIIRPDLLSQEALKTIVALAIGLILFEGGLTLNIKEYRKVSREIKGLLTIGVIVTWLGASICVHFLFPHFSWEFALLAGSLVIVTGPTVVGPLLKRIHAKKKLSSILHWEGILIDPIGVFIALLCYEWISSGGYHALASFMTRFAVGISLGALCGIVVAVIIKKSWISQENLNGFVLASAIISFTLAEKVAHESGLLSVIISGCIIGHLDRKQLEPVKAYKEHLIEILIGLLFILLAANLDVSSFSLYGVPLLIAVLLLMLIVRPFNVFLSTLGSDLKFKEKIFLSWVAPRGIVAASMASLFAINLKHDGIYVPEQAQFLETFTYSVIIATVLFQGLTAGWVGRRLGVLNSQPSGWLIIGAHSLGRSIASFIQKRGKFLVILDSNSENIRQAREMNLPVVCENALTIHSEEYPEMYEIGNIMAITGNSSLNTLICQHWKKELKDVQLYACGKENFSSPFAMRVWEKLPLKKLLEIEQKEHPEIITQTLDAEEIKDHQRVIMCDYEDKLYPFLPPEAQGECTILQYKRVSLADNINIKEDRVCFLSMENISDVVEELLAKIAISYPDLEAETLHQRLSAEHHFSSLMGAHIALYHSYSRKIERSIIAIAKLENSIPILSQKIDVLFFVISPREDPLEHLKTLSLLSQFFLQNENYKSLEAAKNREELLEIFF